MASEPGRSFPRLLRFIVLLLAALLAGSLYYTPSFHCPAKRLQPVQTDPLPTLVLVWLWPFNKTFDLNLCQSRFNVEGCLLTADRNLYDKADAVLVHHRDIALDLSNLPKSPRPPHQKWIWMNSESPSNTEWIPGLDNLFNVSLSYRKDGDISLPYGRVIPLEKELEEDYKPPEKDKIVCWIVSNYNPDHKRTHYYQELQKYIQVNIYGDYFERHVSEEEYREIVASCKFYLSFENSVHKDYITEKLFNALALGAVPVVFGPSRKNYERFVPSDAFIHVEDFTSMRALAKHLYRVNDNEVLYHSYFRWRRQFEAVTTSFPEENACRSCEYVQRNREYQVLTDLHQWFWDGSERPGMLSLMYNTLQ
ncbi:4-galactosyl-N-acetylglucosaminide 3-alpha-L-fucosyltransferase 9 [Astyanax mexicanus]|uniref:4-galactosyl-N-acetylglucosaminide 3-alpha-L-fucosyltransferase 9 n=1 Tax=Astyanax mexicanus TaxID=7994 RepID=UPI0020CB62D8|nr:4-galactosyl-N-acetylglucosaminide 3-alpha-L-fucosyltransferase 9 [Astyanax mexicanus]XP_022523785.2 4-galactosyl-N-acetylglucosaminide 3-alpha-L-fucosyltransferase 9 [Astyanax mexicanus]